MAEDTTKPIYKSKVFWGNVIGAVGTVVGVQTDTIPVEQTPEIAGWVAIGFAALNVLLRFFTRKPVTIKPDPEMPGVGY